MSTKKNAEWKPEDAPSPFEGPGFKDLWQTLLQMPKWKKKPLSAIEMSCKRLKRFDEVFASHLVENAIEGNYQGVVFSDSQIKFEQYQRSKNGTKNFGLVKEKPLATPQPKGGFGKLQ